MSRQMDYQNAQVAAGNCSICGKPRNRYKRFCDAHAISDLSPGGAHDDALAALRDMAEQQAKSNHLPEPTETGNGAATDAATTTGKRSRK